MGTVLRKSVGSEAWAAALVVHGHDDELLVGHSVANGIREPSGGDAALDDFTEVVVDCWCSSVRPARSPYDRRADGDHEAIAQARLLLLIPFPCTEDIELGERVEREGKAHTDRCYERRSSMRSTS